MGQLHPPARGGAASLDQQAQLKAQFPVGRCYLAGGSPSIDNQVPWSLLEYNGSVYYRLVLLNQKHETGCVCIQGYRMVREQYQAATECLKNMIQEVLAPWKIILQFM